MFVKAEFWEHHQRNTIIPKSVSRTSAGGTVPTKPGLLHRTIKYAPSLLLRYKV